MDRGSSLPEAEDFPYPEDYYGHLLLKEHVRFQAYQFQARSPQVVYVTSKIFGFTFLTFSMIPALFSQTFDYLPKRAQ